ncbi:hypothetical protein ACVGWT_03810, partial [Enterobacter hormaechei]
KRCLLKQRVHVVLFVVQRRFAFFHGASLGQITARQFLLKIGFYKRQQEFTDLLPAIHNSAGADF